MTQIATATTATHPLDPLSAAEVAATADLLREQRGLDDRCRFVTVELHEPTKSTLRWLRPEATDSDAAAAVLAAIEREAFAIVIDRTDGAVHEAVVSLTRGEVVRWTRRDGVQPAIMLDEFDEVEEICHADAGFCEALARRGISDVQHVCVEPWSAGFYGTDDGGRRLVRALVYVRAHAGDNPYAHPVDNLVCLVDLNACAVLEVEDYGVVRVPAQTANYDVATVGCRPGLAPIEITQPEGPSFTLAGNELRWQQWRLRIGFTAREGLVLHQVAYDDQGRWRSIVNRASLSEMVVPYGQPSAIQARKNAFDAGEYNIGQLANSLRLGCDCLGEIRYLDAVLCDSRGRPRTIRNAICLHEEDVGLLWKHTDTRTGVVESRRSRRVVLSFIATVANYEYGFYWYLSQDGTIEHEVKLTGILSTAAVPHGVTPAHGQLLNRDGLYAPIHQHLFNARLDLDVDGDRNAVYEVETRAGGSDDPWGNAFAAVETLLTDESEGVRDSSPATARWWKVVNHFRSNAVGEPVAYRLVSSGLVPWMPSADAAVSRRAGFAAHPVWFTRHADDERHAAGDYPNQSRGGDGLPAWVGQGRSLLDDDVVLWHTFGTNHVVRLEDWPVMPVQHTGFKLEPFGFFDRSPALDVPSTEPRHCAAGGDEA
jgi:primary-amine oxidase